MPGKTLLYIPSDEIVDFVSRNPIDWDVKEYARRGGSGDQAGMPPTPAVEEFLDLLLERCALFTQREYWVHCWHKWNIWIAGKPTEQQRGVKAKLYRNFYPSMIDSLHVWSMLCESGMFDTCVLNSLEDAIGKTDLMVRSKQRILRIAFLGPTDSAVSDRAYKMQHRNGGQDVHCVEIQMPKEYPRQPGNKRWFRRSDIMSAMLAADADSYEQASFI